MGWADKAIQKLRQGKSATLKTPEYFKLVDPEEQITVTPCKPGELAVGDVILARVKGDSYLVQIKAIENSRFGVGGLIGIASDWIEANAIYGFAWRKDAIFTRQELLAGFETVAQEKIPSLQYFEYGPNDFQMQRMEETLWFLRGSKSDYHNALHSG